MDRVLFVKKVFIEGFISFVSFWIAALCGAKFKYLHILNLSVIYVLANFGFAYIVGIGKNTAVDLKSILQYSFVMFLSLFIFMPALGLVPKVEFSTLFITMLINFLLFVVAKSRMLKKDQKRKAVIIGTKDFIEKLMHHPSLNAIGVICFDDNSQCLGDLTPNLGNIDDMPVLLEKLEEIPNIILISEHFIAKKLKSVVKCPILYASNENLLLCEES